MSDLAARKPRKELQLRSEGIMGFEKIAPLDILVDVEPEEFLVERLKAFDSNFYRTFPHVNDRSDIEHLDDKDLMRHFIMRGKLEKRAYSKTLYSFIDPVYYRHKYAYLGLQNDTDAIAHWMYHGAFNGFIPNCVTDDLMSARLHLFQMGKVGSKSLAASISAAGHGSLIPHLHFASDMIASYPDSFYSYPEIIKTSAHRIKFISGFREPISRVISGMIQSATESASSLTPSGIINLTRDRERFFELVCKQAMTVADWFCHNFFCGITVYDIPFNRNMGYSIMRGAKHDLFLYNHSFMYRIWEDLSGYCDLSLEPRFVNVTSKTNDLKAELQQELAKIKFPSALLRKIYTTQYCQKFFLEADLEVYVSKYRLPYG